MNDDLISREALKKAITDATYSFEQIPIRVDKVKEIIDKAPTVSLQDIYQEGYYDGHLEGYTKAINERRPQGEWLDIYKSHIAYECSCCGRQMPIADYYKFCPQCGAKMRDKDEIEETEK